jgi:hypothetical protein
MTDEVRLFEAWNKHTVDMSLSLFHGHISFAYGRSSVNFSLIALRRLLRNNFKVFKKKR